MNKFRKACFDIWMLTPFGYLLKYGDRKQRITVTKNLMVIISDGRSTDALPLNLCSQEFVDDVERRLATKYGTKENKMQRQRQADVYKWAVDTFGECAERPQERAMRLVEEVIELAQVCDVSNDVIDKITKRVYGREKGQLYKEIGQVALTLEALAECVGVDTCTAANDEQIRVMTISPEEFRERHAAKTALGITT